MMANDPSKKTYDIKFERDRKELLYSLGHDNIDYIPPTSKLPNHGNIARYPKRYKLKIIKEKSFKIEESSSESVYKRKKLQDTISHVDEIGKIMSKFSDMIKQGKPIPSTLLDNLDKQHFQYNLDNFNNNLIHGRVTHTTDKHGLGLGSDSSYKSKIKGIDSQDKHLIPDSLNDLLVNSNLLLKPVNCSIFPQSTKQYSGSMPCSVKLHLPNNDLNGIDPSMTTSSNALMGTLAIPIDKSLRHANVSPSLLSSKNKWSTDEVAKLNEILNYLEIPKYNDKQHWTLFNEGVVKRHRYCFPHRPNREIMVKASQLIDCNRLKAPSEVEYWGSFKKMI